MTGTILATQGLIKRFGGLIATDDVNLEIATGELHAIIGPNGAGKTTLIRQLSGEMRPTSGTVLLDGQDITAVPMEQRSHMGLARSYQITSIFPDMTARENVSLAVQAHDGHSFRFWARAADDQRLTGPARAALDQVGLTARADIPANALSHGEHRQLEIAMALATKPRLLLLDEPMAGMGPEESARMVALLKTLKRHLTIVLIEHDMDAVFQLADRLTVLVYGRAIATGTPEAIRVNREVRQAYLGDGHGG